MSRRTLLPFAQALITIILATSLAPLYPARAATITVTNTDDSGSGSLRDAISNASVGETIAFNIPGAGVQTIVLESPLPTLASSVIIDGYTQPGSSPATNSTDATILIEIDGENAGNFANGLTLTDHNTARGLVINRFDGAGIRVNSGTGNVIEGNIIGLDADGATALGNGAAQGGFGIFLYDASQTTIGGTTAAARNIISGNGNANGWSGGIMLTNGSANNTVQGNYIGTDITGTLALGNASQGISLDHASGNTIGGTAAGARNLISGNEGVGINIFDTTATNNNILGNFIGTDVTGTTALGNTETGVSIWGAPNNIIGGTAPGAGNLISGNDDTGISIGDGSSGTHIQGNLIGTDVTGSSALGNGYQGIFIVNAANNLIGGTAAGAGNVISANDGGIMLFDAVDGTQIQGNLIGTNASGTAALGNSVMGLWIANVQHVTIGGTTAGARNVISGNGTNPSHFGFGIYFNENSKNNTVQGNFIGTDITGTLAIGNAIAGVAMMRSSNNLIGGNTAAARNIISGNDFGVAIAGNGLPTDPVTPSDNNIVQGNFIGTDVSGALALPNASGGIEVTNGFGNGVHNNIIGGSGPGEGNVISGNGGAGVLIDNGAVGTVVQGNFIGTDVTGAINLGNDINGIAIQGAADNTIGGTTASARNVIAYNDRGVVIFGTDTTGNQILGNSIFSNTELGIDLDYNGVSNNDPDDADVGPNNLQNYPVLSSAETNSATLQVTGTMDAEASKSYRLEFFANAACSPSGNGEGQIFLGFANVMTNGSGDASFTKSFTISVPVGQFISATATDPNHNTSEFSACVEALSAPSAAPARNSFNTTDVTVSWSGVSWAAGYIVEWDDNSAFSNPTSLAPLADTERSAVISVPGNGVYYWRVRAQTNPDTATPWSVSESFTVALP